MFQNPTLKVISLTRSQRLDRAMTRVRETHTLGEKPDESVENTTVDAFDKNRFNVLMQRSLSGLKSRRRQHTQKKADPLDKIDYNKQIEEIDMLINIIKKAGNLAKTEGRTPMVHVPLPREFYELRPLVAFKTISKATQKRKPAPAKESFRDVKAFAFASNVPAEYCIDVSRTVIRQVFPEETQRTRHKEKSKSSRRDKAVGISSNSESTHKNVATKLTASSLPTEVNKPTTTVPNTKETVEKSTLTSARFPLTFDKSTSITARDVPDLVDLDISESKPVQTKSSPTVQRNVQVERTIEPPENKAFREMSTVSSCPNNMANSLPSFEIVAANSFSQVDDVDDLYLAGGTWTVLDPISDPLEKAVHVKIRSTSIRTPESVTPKGETERSDIDQQLLEIGVDKSPKAFGRYDSWDSMGIPEGYREVEQRVVERAKKVTYSPDVPDLDLTPVYKYTRKHARESGLNVNVDNIDLDLQEDFNKMEASIFGEPEVSHRTLSILDKPPKEEREEPKEVPAAENGPRDETEKAPEPAKHKRRKPKSHSRSKKRVPDLHLSDYKGFYVVHTTNDWSFT